MKMDRFLYRIARLTGWILVPVTLLDLLSGYALVHPRIFGGVLGGALGFRLHVISQPAFVALFVLHVLPYGRQALRARRVPALVANGIILIVGAGLTAFAAYLGVQG
jgi:hypothetical protein